jgi:thioester reductase-like protein
VQRFARKRAGARVSDSERILNLLKAARLQLESERLKRREPIAIVGIGCRFPGGVTSPDEYWRLLIQGVDATSDIPAERWNNDSVYDADPDALGKTYVKRGGFLEQIDGFDADFFGISPREASGMDPQQRLLLEITWEALEDAGITRAAIRGTATGVWIGLCVDDYGRRTVTSGDLNRIEPYAALGNMRSVAAGRISYVFDLRGPAVQLDTACSSSLVTVHQACHSLRAGEVDIALAGGVSLMSAPEAMIGLSRLRALAADGRSKTFDASADGYGRGEGCGIVVLKRLSDAEAAGDRIYALLRGSAVNHDGRSNGLTAPNGLAQESVIRAALASAQIEPSSVRFVETHGTGTLLGDPIEVLALSNVYGQGRSRQTPLLLGAVKTNLGHLEGAAGIAGVIKAALCLTQEQIPGNLHFKNPNPKIPWQRLPIDAVTSTQPWPRGPQSRFAGISSFGLSGTNAHIVLQEAPALDKVSAPSGRSAELILLSARTAGAVSAAAGRLRQHLERNPQLALADVSNTLLTGRSLFEHRLAIAAHDRAALLDELRAAEAEKQTASAVRGEAEPIVPKLAWLFTGQGAQQPGMGRELHAQWPVFRAALDEVLALTEPWLQAPLREVMWAEKGTSVARLLDQTGYTQPALFAFEWALAALWRSLGVEPDFVAGHSIGEITAAAFAGVFSLPDAVRLVCARGRLMQELPAGGAMLAIAAREDDVRSAIEGEPRRVALAAVNAPESVVISGFEADVLAVGERFRKQGAQVTRLAVSHAFHSPLMDEMLPAFEAVASTLEYRVPRIPLVSNVTGALESQKVASAAYWVEHVRRPVLFHAGIQTLAKAGVGAFIELGPRATLLGLLSTGLPRAETTLVPSLRSGRSETQGFVLALSSWLATGGSLAATGLFPADAPRVPLPTYPWQRKRYWMEPPSGAITRGLAADEHPVLGHRMSMAGADATYELHLSRTDPVWLADHRIGDEIVFPATAFLELARAASETDDASAERRVKGLSLLAPLKVDGAAGRRVQVVVSEGESRVAIYSRPADGAADVQWSLHATGELEPSTGTPAKVSVSEIERRCSVIADVDSLYASLASLRLNYGPSFKALTRLRHSRDEALGEVRLADGLEEGSYALHPALLDAALHAVAPLAGASWQHPLLPIRCEAYGTYRRGARTALVHVKLLEASSRDVSVDVALLTPAGETIAELHGVKLREVEVAKLLRSELPATAKDFYRLDWQLKEAYPPADLSGQRWVIVPLGSTRDCEVLDEDLRSRGAESRVASPAALGAAHDADHVVCVWDRACEPAEGIQHIVSGALSALQGLESDLMPPRLWCVTRNAVAVASGEDVSPSAAMLWGLARTVMQERPELQCSLIDLGSDADILEALERESASDDGETQVAWRGGRRFVARLVRVSGRALPTSENYELKTSGTGTFDSLELVESEREAPAPGEVEIETYASGLNFRDVLSTLGMYPGEPVPLGGECAGIVTAVGAGVEHVRPGQRVMALAYRAFRRFVTIDARLVAPIPAALSFKEAAGIPAAFLTAWYALHDLARLRAGERILIHAAAGGVGMAACQIARWLGAEVLATASPTKWGALRARGIEHVSSSRDLRFADDFRSIGPVDVVLNSLTGDFVDASLSLLSPTGRFIEMGKADVRDDSTLAITHPGVSYRAFDLADAGPTRIAEMFATIAQGFAEQALSALPIRTFPISDAALAFRFMAQARHVGKIVLLPIPRLSVAGTVLITGGVGALGLEVASMLARRGVEHLVLCSRRGLDGAGAADAILSLERLGAKVTVAAIDVANRAAVERLLAEIPREYPLQGIVHAAAVVDDGLLADQSAERLRAVLAPKVEGAWHLHELTSNADLAFFVAFSSIASTFGSAAQSGYTAGNAFLDALMLHRRAQGLPGVSISWGPWSEKGLAANLDAALKLRFARQGIGMLSSAQGIALFEQALVRPEPHLLAVAIDWSKAAKFRGSDVPPLWRAMLRQASQATSDSQERWIETVLAVPPEKRLELVNELARAEVAKVLSLDQAAQVGLDTPLEDLGVDSLMGVELRNALSERTGLALPVALALDHRSVSAIARFIVGALAAPGEKRFSSRPPPAVRVGSESEDVARTRAISIVQEELRKSLGPDASIVPGLAETIAERVAGALAGGTERGAAPAFASDAVLAPSFVAPAGTSAALAEPTVALLTGATGFLGAFLLSELLDQTTSEVICLVRARDEATGLRRLADNLSRYGLVHEDFRDRVSVRVGDLAQPRLGLSEGQFHELGERVDAIYNNGAKLSYVVPYASLKASHVGGTLEMLRLCTLGKPKALHHVSSIVVYESPAYQGLTVDEAIAPSESRGIRLGYSQSKWVSESLVRAAAARGIPAVVYRPGLIGGSSATGAANADDLLCRMMRGIIALSSMPDLDIVVDFSPVDYVARSIVSLSRQARSRGKAFHLNAPRGIHWQELLKILNSLGHDVQMLPHDEWITRLTTDTNSPLFPLLPYLQRRSSELTHLELFQERYRARVTCDATAMALAPAGIVCPPIERSYISRCLSYLSALGLLSKSNL